MQLALYAVSFLAISQLLFMGLFYLLYFRRQVLGVLLALLSFCLISFILISLLPVTENYPLLYFLLGRFTIATPAVLWIVAHYLFIDDRKISAAMWTIIIAYQIVRAASLLFFDQNQNLGIVLTQINFAVMLGLSIDVILIAFNGRRHDLIEQRRRLRVPFSLGLGTIIAMIVALSMISTFMDPDTAGTFLGYATLASCLAIFIFTLVMNLATFNLFKESPLLTTTNETKAIAVEEKDAIEYQVDPDIISKITLAMEAEELFTEPKLTIGDLAKKIHVQEYKLRRIINKGLGYRNFNQFLNQYRVDAASKLLLDSRESQLPISTIALDVGYASLSSFNKAFKEIKGMTPSAYRSSGVNDELGHWS